MTALMTPAALVGYLAASLVFATFCAKRIVPLRVLAIASNIAFVGYGYVGELWPIVILHIALLLPLNIYRLRAGSVAESPETAKTDLSDVHVASVSRAT
jgi:ABC-type glycerol-3-phosphate transport system permease component